MHRVAIAIFIIIVFSSCYVSLKSIATNPKIYNGQTVKIKGIAEASVSYNDINVIYLREGEYVIPIISHKKFWIKNQIVITKGKVITNFIYHNRDTLPVAIIIDTPKGQKKL